MYFFIGYLKSIFRYWVYVCISFEFEKQIKTCIDRNIERRI